MIRRWPLRGWGQGHTVLPRSVVGYQIIAVAVGLAASLIPGLPGTQCFWGCLRTWRSDTPHMVQVHDLAPASPADAAGLRANDLVLAIDDRPIDGTEEWDAMTGRVQPAQEVRRRIKRWDEESTLIARGIEPQVEALLYYDWQ